ncbi:hypothetical protein BGZ61DRAFT_412189 [Ilyonectria robusta]|uniref:uncharacterized protein n=1 Tax=Ilyonectria robusta TaxID=1079257 RepID=UPI001E8E8E0E|nr:uncharacterized protein BGZ61DRAFT_412189 [Ilyonectria robusta]KAH8734663.1 hypothetical protein BGZ61DRAFT_412189 [Ilyonectria robusta]
MPDLDEPGWSWPAWKFGMKRDDLFTKLHDQYNTFSFNIQDPEAFHHDVYEISRDADTPDEFHRLMADRQRQRLTELHESLESLAVEIIANPKLMDSEHWQYALQLFRTKSFDSIVRYFASYLPDSYLDQHDTVSISSSTYSETNSVKTESTSASSVDDASLPSFFGDDDEVVMTKEPLSIHTNIRSSHSGPFGPDLTRSHVHDDDETSQSDDCESAATSDCAESPSSLDETTEEEHVHDGFDEDLEDEYPAAQFPEDAFDAFDFNNDTLDSDTPTPRQETIASCYIEYKSVVSRRIPSPHRRSPSPSPKHHFAHRHQGSSFREIRRSPDEALSKVQKPMPDPIRRRTGGRRRLD